MRKKKRILIFAVILIMAIGFATVATTLFINGSAIIGSNESDFDVYFSASILDDTDISSSSISADKKSIVFNSKDLTYDGDKSVLEYDITNSSSQYNADVKLNCLDVENDNIKVTNSFQNVIIKALETKTGFLTVELKGTPTEYGEFDIVCEIDAGAVSRETPADPTDYGTYDLYGYFVDDQGEPVPNANLVIYSDDPHYVTTDERGYLYVKGLLIGEHEVYYLKDKTMEEIKELSKDEVIDTSETSVDFTTSTRRIVFPNSYEITESVVEQETPRTYVVTLDPNGGTANVSEIQVIQNKPYGELPTPVRVGYDFLGWYYNSTKITSELLATPKDEHTLVAKWSGIDFIITYNLNGGTLEEANPSSYTSDDQFTLNNPSKRGYTFTGWQLNDEEELNLIVEIEKYSNGDRNYTANYVANQYTLAFETNGGTTIDNKTIVFDNEYGELPTTEKPGYEFLGWYSDAEFTTEVKSTDKVNVTENQTLYAKWSTNGYSITYNLVGGTIEGVNPVEFNPESETITIINPTKEGYTFIGWSGTGIEGKTTELTIPKGSYGNREYTANYSANQYTLSYVTDSIDTIESKSVTYGSTYGSLPTPTKEGYTFAGWYKESTLENKVLESTLVTTTNDHSLYAAWTINSYTLTINNNNGTDIETKKLKYGEEYEIPRPTSKGYSFQEWNLAEGSTGTINGNLFVMGAGDSTVTAVWMINDYSYAVKHYIQNVTGNGYTLKDTDSSTKDVKYGTQLTPDVKEYVGFTSPEKKTITISDVKEENVVEYYYTRNQYTLTINPNGGTYNGDLEKTLYYEEEISISSITKKGYIFSGWSITNNDSTLVDGTFKMGSSNTTLTASFDANEYTITFESNGGSKVNNITRKYNTLYGELETPTRTGYTFTGWYNDEELNNKVESTSTVLTASNHTLYAGWEAIKSLVSFNANGGTVNSTSIQVTYDQTYSELPSATRVGYTFAGWFTDKTNGVEIKNTDKVEIVENIELFAHWSVNDVTVLFDALAGTVSEASRSVTFNSTYGAKAALPTPVLAGYTFTGWYTDAVEGTKVVDDTKVTNALEHTLYARYSINDYVLTINENNGSSSKTENLTYGKTTTIANPTRTGYTFDGWDLTGTNSTLVDGVFTMGTANATLTAKWIINSYKLTIDYNDDTDNVESTLTYGEAKTIVEPTRTGYTFAGWDITGVGASIEGTSFVMGSSNATLTAKWTINSYKLTIDNDNGSANSEETLNYKETLKLDEPSKTGYTFAGWDVTGTDSSVTGDTFKMGSENATVKAKWTINSYKLTIVYNNGTASEEKTLNYNETSTITEPTKVGHVFAGWTVSGTGASLTGTTFVMGSSNATITANWTTISYGYVVKHLLMGLDGTTYTLTETETIEDANFGTKVTPNVKSYTGFTAPETQTITISEDTTKNIVEYKYTRNKYKLTIDEDNGSEATTKNLYYEETYTLPTVTKNGYTFAGWVIAGTSAQETSGTFKMGSSAASATASWTINKYDITVRHLLMNTDGTTYTLKETEVIQNVTYNTAVTPDIKNYVGFTAPTTKEITANYDTSKNVVEYKYTREQHDLTIVYGNGKSSSTEKMYYGATKTITNPVYNGYTFTNWSLNNTTSVLEDGVFTMGTEDTTMTANYTANKYSVSFDSDGGSTCQSIEVTFDGKYGTLCTPAKEGNTFEGWYTDKTYATAINSNSKVTVNKNHTLYAKWSINNYVVAFDSKGGSPVEAKSITYGTTYGTLAETTRDGYIFGGWYKDDETFANKVLETSIMNIAAGHTLYAKWTPIVYTITYTMNGYSGVTNPSTYTIESEEIPLLNPSKTGYTFSGWTGSNGITPSLNVIIPTGSIGNKEYTANGSANTYKVTFDTQGGSSVPDKNVTYDSTYTSLSTSTKTGYTFGGWYTSKAYTTQIKESSVVNIAEDHTLYAKWNINSYSIKVDCNNGTEATTSDYQYNSVVNLPSCSLTGYSFQEWTITEGTTGSVSGNKYTVGAGNATLTAVWLPNDYTYVVKHYYQNINSTEYTLGDIDVDPKTAKYGTTVTPPVVGKTGFTSPATQTITISEDTTKNIVEYYYVRDNFKLTINSNGGIYSGDATKNLDYEQTTTLLTPTKTGYTFNGWNITGTGSSVSGTTFTMGSANTTITAKWTANTYKVSFNAPCAAAIDDKNVTYGSTYGSLSTPTCTGYTFGGWYLESNYTNKVLESTTVSVAKNHTLYAKFEANKIVVDFDSVGGTPTPTSIEVTYDQTYGTLPTVTKTGYTFAGWWTSSTAGTQVKGTDTVKITARTTLYAHWSVNSYLVTFDANGGTVSENSRNVTYATTYGSTATLPIPTRTGYTFKGWYSDNETFANKIIDTTSMTTAAAHTLYAKWEINSYDYTIIYGNGSDNDTGKLNYQETLTLTVPPRTGYTFAGWTVSGTGSAVNDNVLTMGSANVTVTAKWTAIEYTLKVVYGNGTDDASSIMTIGQTKAVANPTRTGYTFAGWTVTGTGASMNGTTFTMGSSNATLTAKWNINSYDYTIDNANDDAKITGSLDYGATKTLTVPTREGYTFDGWTVTGTGASVNASNVLTMGTANVTVTAKWKINSYTLTVKTGCGVADTTSSLNYKATTTVNNPAACTGYTFSKWTVSGTGATLTGTTFTMGSSNATLTAVWVPNNYDYQVKHLQMGTDGKTYTVVDTEEKNAAFGSTVTPSVKTYTGFKSPSTQTITINNDTTKNIVEYKYERNKYNLTIDGGAAISLYYGETKTIPTPTQTGYTFTGWTVTGTGATMVDGTFTMGTSNATLTSNRTINSYNYTIIYGNGSDNDTGKLNYQETLTLTVPTRTGYTFDGWTVSGTGSTVLSNILTMGSANVTVTAKWKINSYTLTIKAGCGVADTTSSLNYKATTTVNNPAACTGYTFNGWDITGTGSSVSGTTFTMGSENTTLTAKWTPISYTVSYSSICGTVTNKTVTYDSAYGTDAVPTLTCAGYTFDGWYKESSYTNKVTSDTKVKTAGNHTLYAKWTANSYTVSFNSNGGSTISDKSVIYKSTYGSLSSPTRTGYTFSGWYLEDTLTNKVLESTIVNTVGNHTLYAAWTPITYTITYTMNGFSATNPTSYTIETPTFTLNNPTKTGWTFTGWTGSNGTTASTSVSINKGSTGAKAYTANGTINSYVVTIVVSGGYTNKETVSVNYGGTDTITLTPENGFYLETLTCTNGYTTNAQTGLENYEAQEVTITGTQASAGTCTATFKQITASDLSYDNTNTGLDCSTVQCAIDELYKTVQ